MLRYICILSLKILQAFRSSFCQAEAAEKAAWTQKAKAEALGRREAAELDALQAECTLPQGHPKSTREPTVVNREAQQKSLADDKAKLEVELANVRSARPLKLSHVSHVSTVWLFQRMRQHVETS